MHGSHNAICSGYFVFALALNLMDRMHMRIASGATELHF